MLYRHFRTIGSATLLILVTFCTSSAVEIKARCVVNCEVAEQPLPPNGQVRPQVNASDTAPLRILTKAGDGHYYIKLEETGTGRSVLTVFVRSGHQVDMRVPFGTYVMKYASGQKWYGYEHLFGPNTAYNKAGSTYAFRREGDKIKGFQITMNHAEGNDTPSPIKPNDF
jgi:hypothetical protein